MRKNLICIQINLASTRYLCSRWIITNLFLLPRLRFRVNSLKNENDKKKKKKIVQKKLKTTKGHQSYQSQGVLVLMRKAETR